MKKVLCTAIVLIIFGTAWMLYLQREDNRFGESLPKVPSRMNTEQPIDTVTQENTTENENIGLPVAANVPQESTNGTEEMRLNTAYRSPHDSNPHSHDQKLNEPFFRALLKDKPTEVVIERTPEESLESSRVTAILFPNEANKKAYRDELKEMKHSA